ncbi:MAG: LptF/LptG family permease [Treponema sp.]|nr:LptF/LptG family permease [Treponema sp.]
MKLVLYLYRKFFPIFFGSLIFFVFAVEIVDLLLNLWKYISNQTPPLSIAYVLLLYIPKAISYAIPLSILFASSYTLSDFYANNELIAVFASGVSLFRFTLPLLLLSFLLSFGMFYFEDFVVVPTYAKKTELQRVLLKLPQSKDNDRIVVLSEGGNVIYKAAYYEDASQKLHSVFIVLRNEQHALDAVVYADTAIWNALENHWVVTSSSCQYTPSDLLLLRSDTVQSDIISRLSEPPETFRNNTVSVEEVTTTQAREYISHLVRTGLPAAEAQSLYYKKFSFPFVLFIVVFLSIGLSGQTQKNILLISFALSIAAAVGFYVTQMVSMLFAKFGYISPFAGAWFPVIVFTGISILLLRYART